MEIKVYGTGCAKCGVAYDLMVSMVNELGIKATVKKVSNLSEMMEHGLINTPAIAINGEIKSSGKVPTAEEVKVWLTEKIN